MNILISGGGGFLGQGMVTPLAQAGHKLRLMGRKPIESEHESIAGDVTNIEDVRKAVKGMDAIIINHMAPWKPNSYETPEACYNINVIGGANMLFAAEEAGIKKAVVISTTGIGMPDGIEDISKWRKTIPLESRDMYTLTKSCLETTAMHYSRNAGMQVSILRIGYVVDGDEMNDKYGREVSKRAPADTDRRDVGEVARLCLERDDIELESFVVMSTKEAMSLWDVQYTVDKLGWQPRYDFDRLPL